MSNHPLPAMAADAAYLDLTHNGQQYRVFSSAAKKQIDHLTESIDFCQQYNATIFMPKTEDEWFVFNSLHGVK